VGATISSTPPVDESVRVRPAEALRPLVAWYSGYRQEGLPAAHHRGLPSPWLTLIFTLGEPLTIAGHPDPRQAPAAYQTLLGGLHTSPALITHQGRQAGIQLALHPLGTQMLLGLPAGELAGIDLDARDVLGSAAREIHERLQEPATWSARFALLDRLLLGLARPYESPAPELVRAWEVLLRSGGTVPVAGLARETGWSERHLANRFHREIGLAPKAAARVIRFHRARRRLDRRASSGTVRLAELAADCGYYDQAHLAREFRALAGCSPSGWLAEEFRNVQAADPAAAEG
jgi:AraC-like DNA-binding protein